VLAIFRGAYQKPAIHFNLEFCSVAVDDLYYLTVQIRTLGNVTQIGLGFVQTVGTNGPDTLQAACANWQSQALPTLLLMLSDQVRVQRIEMVPVTEPLDIPGCVDLVAQDGAVVGDALPSAMAAVVSLPTDAPNAKHNGRIYISGVIEAGAVLGTLTVAQQALNGAFAAKLNDDLIAAVPETAEFRPVVISRIVAGVPRVPPVGFVIQEPIARPIIRQQRRRKTRSFGLSA